MRLKHSRLTHFQTNKLLEHFCAGVTARTAADLAGLRHHLSQCGHRASEKRIEQNGGVYAEIRQAVATEAVVWSG